MSRFAKNGKKMAASGYFEFFFLTSNPDSQVSFLTIFVRGTHFWTSSYNYSPHEGQNLITIRYSEIHFLIVVQ